MNTAPEASALVKETARAILRYLRSNPRGASKEQLVTQTQTSKPSVQRALTWLRDAADSPVEFDRAAGKWLLRDAHFSLPLSDPEPEDLAAVMFAEALLAPLADEEITQRVRRLAEQMDAEIRDRNIAGGAPGTRPGTVVASVTTGSTTDPQVLATLLGAIGKSVVRITYASPWSGEGVRRTHDLEPWQLRVHDGGLYLRAWSRKHESARSFRVANIESAAVLSDTEPAQRVPPVDKIWGADDPAFGIDHDRPDVATIRLRGGVARWTHRIIWHPEQKDTWLEQGELLERVVPYRSCRELARRLLSLGTGVESVEPAALRDEILAHVEALRALGPSDADPPA